MSEETTQKPTPSEAPPEVRAEVPTEGPNPASDLSIDGVSSELFAEALEAVEAAETRATPVTEAEPADAPDSAEDDEVEFLDIDELAEAEVIEVDEARAEADPRDEELERARSRVEQLEDELQIAQQQTRDTHERLVRKAADFENARKRHQREKQELGKFASEAVLKEMLPVLDDLERALQHAGDAAESTLASGVEMVVRKFGQALARRGVTPVNPEGEPFDPTFHEALQQVDDPSVPHNTIHQVFQKGYLLHDRLLRPALVVVAQGGPPRGLVDASAGAEAAPSTDAGAPTEEGGASPDADNVGQSLDDAASGVQNDAAKPADVTH